MGTIDVKFDVKGLLESHRGENYDLHAAHVNPKFTKVLRTIGFDRCYVRAEGPYLWDEQGQRYLDFLSGYGVFNVGRNHPYIRDALTDFMAEDYPSLVQMEAPLLSGLLAEKLKTWMPFPGLERVYFTNSGAEGVETAIKFARCATGRARVAYAAKAFHGLTSGALAINGDEVFRQGFGDLLDGCERVPFNDLEALEALLRSEQVAAFIIEPIQGKGVNIAAPGYLREAQKLCKATGTLFVLDEVQTGVGRTGKFLAAQHDGAPAQDANRELTPDMVILSKALSGGYVPVGAVLSTPMVHDKVFSSMDRAVVHSSTFGQNSLAMIAGLATLELIERDELIENAARQGDYIGNGLREMATRYEFIKDVRWRGLMLAIEFGEPRSLGLRSAWKIAHGMDKSLFPQAVTMPMLQDHQILTQVAGHHIDVIKLLPPLVITQADCDTFLHAFDDVMQRLHRFPGPVWEALSAIGRQAIKRNRTQSQRSERSLTEA